MFVITDHDQGFYLCNFVRYVDCPLSTKPFGINKIWVQVKEESRIFLELFTICWWHGRTYCLTLTISNLFFPQTNLTLTLLFKEKTPHSMICSLLLLVAKWQKITTTKKKKKKRKHTHIHWSRPLSIFGF